MRSCDTCTKNENKQVPFENIRITTEHAWMLQTWSLKADLYFYVWPTPEPLRYRLCVGFHLYFCVVVGVDAQLHMQRERVKPGGGALADQSQHLHLFRIDALLYFWRGTREGTRATHSLHIATAGVQRRSINWALLTHCAWSVISYLK